MRRGIGRECLTRTGPVTGRAALMEALDVLNEGSHRLPAWERIDASDLDLYATAVNHGAPLRASTKRLLLRQARRLKEKPQ